MTLQSSTQPMADSFASLGIQNILVEALNKLSIETPTPIQAQAIPLVLAGRDVLGVAQTGTGKTLAFGLPLIQQMKESSGDMLVLVPTRELAEQVLDNLGPLARLFSMRCALIIGGASMDRQRQQMRNKPRLIVATPGRLVDLIQQRVVDLSTIRFLVLDEADRMLDMGFAPQLKQILVKMPAERRTLLFSATMPPEIRTIASQHMKDPQMVQVAPEGTASKQVEQCAYLVRGDAKLAMTQHLLTENTSSVLIFVRTKHGARKLTHVLTSLGHSAAEIHGDRSQAQRRMALAGFKAGRYRILVATDIAARGLDVREIGLVLNYDLPDASADYVHRIGRTGRAGHQGLAISLVTGDQKGELRVIERLIRQAIPVNATPTLPELTVSMPRQSERVSRPHNEGPRNSNQRTFQGRGKRSFGYRRAS